MFTNEREVTLEELFFTFLYHLPSAVLAYYFSSSTVKPSLSHPGMNTFPYTKNIQQLSAEVHTCETLGSLVYLFPRDLTTRQKQPEQKEGDENPSGEPGTENDGEEAFPSDVWIKRSRGGAQKRLPAHTALTDRVRQGNDLVSARRAMDA